MNRIMACGSLIAFMTFGSYAVGATVEPETMDHLITTDVMGYDCVQEEDLDAAFMLSGKGTVPQTCLTEAPPVPDCDIMDPLVGRDLIGNECAAFKYRWFRQFDPDRVLFVDLGPLPKPKTSVVPLPAGLGLLISAIAGLGIIRKFAT